jgi:hypothetical protein
MLISPLARDLAMSLSPSLSPPTSEYSVADYTRYGCFKITIPFLLAL